ncbi:hypothetical protein NQZ68_037156 [Dissostichus eleginoides]|nr:hypothetical protein NQZ68_037156 [Dissostichus eleginoides]
MESWGLVGGVYCGDEGEALHMEEGGIERKSPPPHTELRFAMPNPSPIPTVRESRDVAAPPTLPWCPG